MGKNKWLSLFSAVDASSVPRSEWMKRGVVCSNKTCSELFIYAGEGDFQKGRRIPRHARETSMG